MELGADLNVPLVLFFQALDQLMELNLRFQGELFNPTLAIGLGFVFFLCLHSFSRQFLKIQN